MSTSTAEQLKKQRLAELKTKISHIPAFEDCKDHGFRPKEYNVLVAVSANVEKTTAGGIIIPDSTIENMEEAGQTGRLIAVSPLAFTYSDKWDKEDYPKVGDLIVFARFAGNPQVGLDGVLYRVCKDQDVMSVYDNELVEKVMSE